MESTQRYFEDIPIGQKFELGSVTVTEDEIIRFAREFDPQPFHIDKDAAQDSMFGGLIASGWHTNALYMKLFVTTMMEQFAGRGSPGVDMLRWKRPVRPGDVLHGEFEVLEKKPYRGGMGLIRAANRFINQDGKEVMHFIGLMLIARRESR